MSPYSTSRAETADMKKGHLLKVPGVFEDNKPECEPYEVSSNCMIFRLLTKEQVDK